MLSVWSVGAISREVSLKQSARKSNFSKQQYELHSVKYCTFWILLLQIRYESAYLVVIAAIISFILVLLTSLYYCCAQHMPDERVCMVKVNLLFLLLPQSASVTIMPLITSYTQRTFTENWTLHQWMNEWQFGLMVTQVVMSSSLLLR